MKNKDNVDYEKEKICFSYINQSSMPRKEFIITLQQKISSHSLAVKYRADFRLIILYSF